MFSIISLVVAYLGYVSAHFDGQVTSVMSHIDMENSFLSYGSGPGQYTGLSGAEDEDEGHFSTTSESMILIQSVDLYPLSAEYGDETHFQYLLDFASTVINGTVASPLGSNSDPVYGCLMAGPFFENESFSFILTNNKVYGYIQQGLNIWAIPVKDRISVEVNLYTIVINRNQRRVLFRIDNKTYLDAPGYCGIDSKFNIGLPISKACSPAYTAENFIEAAYNRFFIGALATLGPLQKGFCQGGLYKMCNDNISFAPGCVCKYSNTFPGNVTLGYTANVRSIGIFTMGTTNRCDGESSSSSYHNWWSRPVKAGEESEKRVE